MTPLDGRGELESVAQVTMIGGSTVWASKEGVKGLLCTVTTDQFPVLMAITLPLHAPMS